MYAFCTGLPLVYTYLNLQLLLNLLQNLETALAGGLGEMSLVNDYQTFQLNLGSSSVVVWYRAW